MNSCLYECQVTHARFSPRAHRFAYRIFLFALDLDELAALDRRLPFFSIGRRNFYSYRDTDFLPTHEPLHNSAPGSAKIENRESKIENLKARVVAHLAAQGIDLTGGRVLLVTLPRVVGYLFNPVSFYFCYDRTGAPVAALAEVTNTFKEMKPYLLGPDTRQQSPSAPRPETPPPSGSPLSAPGSQLAPSGSQLAPTTFHSRVPKHFYVSPYSDVDVAFDFTLRTPGEKLSVQIDDYTGPDRTLTSTLSGARRELTGARLAWFTLKYPAITLRVITLIHWHALLLWLKRVPFFGKASRAADQRDLYRPHVSIAHAQPSDAA